VTEGPDDPAVDAWRGLLVAHSRLVPAVEADLRAAGQVPLSWYDVLLELNAAPDRRLRMSELATNSLSSRSRLSHAVARMEEAGWVRRRACPTDKRGQLAELTAAGFERLDSAARGHVEEVRALLFDVLTPDQQRALREISDAITNGLGDRTA
jgi:DNA-binding MarR family transcriptional regulator